MATAEATESTREFSSDTQELGDRIVGLTLKAAKELSDYHDVVHGIKPASGGAVLVVVRRCWRRRWWRRCRWKD